MCRANGAPTPGLRLQLANDAANDIALGHAQTLSRIQQLQNFGAIPVHSRRATCSLFILTTFLCTLQLVTSTRTSYTQAATLDTGRVASTYPGGISPRSSIGPCQSARPSDCSPLHCVRNPCIHRVIARKPTKHSPMFLVDYVALWKSLTDIRESIMFDKLS